MAGTKQKESLHNQISDFIRDKIYSNEWSSGEQIPSEFTLMKMFDVSRGTVQKAILTVANEGLLEQIQGKGTFVKKPMLRFSTGGRFLSFAESLRTMGVDFQTDILEQTVMPATKVIAEKLRIEEGANVLKLDRLRRSGDEPLLFQESCINLIACPGIENCDYAQTALFDAVEQASNRAIGYSKARYAARIAGKRRGQLLGIDTYAPVLNMDMVVYLEDNTPTEWVNVWLPSNKYVLASVMQRF